LQCGNLFTAKTLKMKTCKVIFIGIAFFATTALHAQVAVNVNIGAPPMWGPVGYTNVQYYYLPDVEAYYDIPSSMFIYQSGRVWVHRTYLPVRYRSYDLYSGYKVVMTDYHGKTPYHHHKEYKMKYAKGYRGPAQKNIGERPGKGYNKSRVHAGSYSNHKESQGSVKSKGNSNKNSKKGNNNGGGHGKKK